MTNYIENPCKRDCPDRRPGCCCQKRKEWVEQQKDIKNFLYENDFDPFMSARRYMATHRKYWEKKKPR